MKNRIRIRKETLLVALLALGAASCDDIIQPNLSNQHVTLLTPADSTRSTRVVQSFRWEPVDGASHYRIQIGSSASSASSDFFLDSLISHPSFSQALAPGWYYWQVKAVNASYASDYSTRTLQVDSTGALTGQTLPLQQPGNNALSRGGMVKFAWGALPMAQRYLLQLTPNPRSSGGSSLDTLLGNVTSVAIRLPPRSQVYQWKVTALNATGLTNSATWRFEVDTQAPTAPALTAPAAAEAFSALPITLSWTRSGADVAQDSVFLFRADQITALTGFPRLSSAASLVLSSPATVLTTGSYYWAVRSMDQAGNAGPLSAKRQLIIQ